MPERPTKAWIAKPRRCSKLTDPHRVALGRFPSSGGVRGRGWPLAVAVAALAFITNAAAAGAGAMGEAGALALGGQITAVALRGDGRQAAALTAANGGTLVLVDLQQAPVLRKSLYWASVSESAVGFSPDGRWLVFNGIDSRLYDALALADSSTGEVVAKVPVQGRRPPALAFSPDGRWLAVSTREQSLTVFNLRPPPPQGLMDRLLAWVRPRPSVTMQVHRLGGQEVRALSFNAAGDRLNVHRRGEVIELQAPDFVPATGRALKVLNRDAWVTVCAQGVAEFLGSENPVLMRHGPAYLALPHVDAGSLGKGAIAMPFDEQTLYSLTIPGELRTSWCDEALGRLYVLTDLQLATWDVGEARAPRRLSAFAVADPSSSQFPEPSASAWHAAINRRGEISVRSLQTGAEIGWVTADAASGSTQRAAARWLRLAADSRAGLLVTGAENGTLRFWRPQER